MRKLFAAGIFLLTLSLPLLAQSPEEAGGALDDSTQLLLKYASFDPLAGLPLVPPALAGGSDTHLWIVQLQGRPNGELRAAIQAAGGELHGYLPHHAYIVRMQPSSAATLIGFPGIRWVGHYEPAFRLESMLVAEIVAGIPIPVRRYNIVVADKHTDKPALAAAIRALGGEVLREQPGSILFEVQLSGAQLIAAARLDQVLWIDRWSPPEEDMNNARIQGGANFIESAGGFTGSGINGHVYEGLEASHPDFTHTPINVQSCGSAQSHGHCTAGIIFGNGTSHPLARGMAPDAQPFYTNYSCVSSGMSRWQVVQDLVSNHEVMFTTASWGNARTRQYTSISADADDIIFDHDIPWTQSQSNAHNQDSRPQAWAKNIFSIGAVEHFDNADRLDDSWAAGGASTGPAADGRIKPDLCAYYDAIMCSDRTGTAGYSNQNYFSGFGGTSGATPIVAGHNALAIQMFTDHIFNNPPRVPGGSRFQNRPHFTTLKALMIANARQYAFSATSSDNRRDQQGWGFPDLKTMYNNSGRMFLVDETDLLTQGQSRAYSIQVNGNEPELKIAMTYADPAGNPAASITRINDLSLRVTAPDATIYWGNHGLRDGNYSTPGGSSDDRDTVECVFVHNPMPGTWTVEVLATLIAQDSHVETPALDADFALCVTFGTRVGAITTFGQGCTGTGQLPSYCESINPAGGTLNRRTAANEYAYPMQASAPLTIVGFRLWTAASSGSATVTTGFYRDAGGVPAANAVATSTMQVGSAEQFYDTTFSQPISVPAGATFYLACDHDQCYVSTLTSGAPGIGYYRRPPRSGGAWSLSGIVQAPALQVVCQGSGGQNAVPLFDVDGPAEIGTPLDLTLRWAAPATSAVLYTGISNQVWNSASLPLDLAPLGAPGCAVLVSLDVSASFPTGPSGAVSSTLPIPVDPSIIGADLYQQFLVVDPGANQLGIAASNAANITIGG